MANLSEELKIRILADISGLKSDMEQAKKAIVGFEEKTAKVANGFKRSTDGMLLQIKRLRADIGAVTFAVTGMTAAVGLFIKTQLQAAKETRQWAKQLSVAEGDFVQLTAVAHRFGATTDDVGDAIKDLNERIADAAGGNKTYEEALNRVRLSSKDLIDLPVEEQFLKVADAIGKMNNAGDRNFVTAELMADAGFRLIPMFQQGAAGIDKMRKEVLSTNEALDNFELKKLEEAGTSIMEMERQFSALANTLMIQLSPAVDAVALSLKGWADILGANSEKELPNLITKSEELGTELKKLEEQLSKVRSGDISIRGSKEATIKRLSDRIIDLGFEYDEVGRKIKAIGESQDPLLERIKEYNKVGPMVGPMNQAGVFTPPQDDGGLLQSDDGVGASFPLFEADKAEKDLLLQNLLDYQENEWEYKNAQRERELEANRGFWDSMLMIDEKAKNANAALWQSGWQGKMQVASKFMGQMSSMMDSNSRKQFEIGKAAAIAQVAIDTPKAAMAAYASMAGIPYIGPVLGIAAAAAAVASGASQIQNIKSQTMGDGSVNAGGISGGGGAGAGGGQQQAAPENVLDATFNIQGSSVSADSVRQLGSSLNEYIEDGFRIRSVQVV